MSHDTRRTDAERLDWLQRTKDASFRATNSSAHSISKVTLFTVRTQHITAPDVRAAIDLAMDIERAET